MGGVPLSGTNCSSDSLVKVRGKQGLGFSSFGTSDACHSFSNKV